VSDFDYIRIEILDEALGHLADGQGRILAGGTDLLILLKHGKLKPRRLVDITCIPAVRVIKEDQGFVTLGAGVTFTELIVHPLVSLKAWPLRLMARQMGSLQIRNIATVGGNVANASACADSSVPLLALEACLSIQSAGGRRRSAEMSEHLEAELEGVALKPNEMIVDIKFAALGAEARAGYVKLGRRNALNIARLSMCSIIRLGPAGKIERASIALGAVAPQPFRVQSAERLLVGCAPGTELLQDAVEEVSREVARSLGSRASAPYKNRAIRGVADEALRQCFDGFLEVTHAG
jgi:CO/xanthine dehydrogenase FAD-binding subunit